MAELPPEVRELFEGANFAHLATVMADGSPHSVAIWAGLEGDNVVFFTQEGSLKARNMERDPRVAISITDHDDPYQTAQLRGEVVEVRGAEAAHEVRRGRALDVDVQLGLRDAHAADGRCSKPSWVERTLSTRTT